MKEDKSRREFWSRHSKRWEQSGISQGEYCDEEGINKNTFQYWRGRLLKEGKHSNDFIEIDIKPKSTKNLQVEVNNKYMIKVPDRFDPETLKKLIKTLEQA